MIKSDKWIRRTALATRMIEPFEPGQVREVDGKKIVSYGTSSYGYDMRVAREFKIFTNALSAIVDPKAFDPKSFVDHVGDRVGMDRFNTVWSGPDTLPLPDEIEDPQQWIDRVL